MEDLGACGEEAAPSGQEAQQHDPQHHSPAPAGGQSPHLGLEESGAGWPLTALSRPPQGP